MLLPDFVLRNNQFFVVLTNKILLRYKRIRDNQSSFAQYDTQHFPQYDTQNFYTMSILNYFQ